MNIKQHINLKKPQLSRKPVNPPPDNQELSVAVFQEGISRFDETQRLKF
jgi:hypothetical protein